MSESRETQTSQAQGPAPCGVHRETAHFQSPQAARALQVPARLPSWLRWRRPRSPGAAAEGATALGEVGPPSVEEPPPPALPPPSRSKESRLRPGPGRQLHHGFFQFIQLLLLRQLHQSRRCCAPLLGRLTGERGPGRGRQRGPLSPGVGFLPATTLGPKEWIPRLRQRG